MSTRPETAAQGVRAEQGIVATAAVSDLVTLIEEDYGAGVAIVPLPSSIEGMYLRHRGRDLIVSTLRPAVRVRFTLAHELGHLVLGHGSGLDTPSMISGNTSELFETEANRFAAELLVPTAGIITLRAEHEDDPPLDFIVRAATSFEVSPLSMTYRCVDAGIVSQEECDEWLAKKVRDSRSNKRIRQRLGIDSAEISPTQSMLDSAPRFPRIIEENLQDLVRVGLADAELFQQELGFDLPYDVSS